MNNNAKRTIKISLIATYSSMVFALQVVMGPIPNVEVVTFMLSIAAIIFTIPMAIIISLVFAFLEALFYGYGEWVILYLIIWPLLVCLIILFKPLINVHWLFFVLINSLFGFAFGSIDSIAKLLLYGKEFWMAYWIKGLPFDLIHGVSNFIVALLLYKPIINIYNTNLKKYLV